MQKTTEVKMSHFSTATFELLKVQREKCNCKLHQSVQLVLYIGPWDWKHTINSFYPQTCTKPAHQWSSISWEVIKHTFKILCHNKCSEPSTLSRGFCLAGKTNKHFYREKAIVEKATADTAALNQLRITHKRQRSQSGNKEGIAYLLPRIRTH